MKLRKRIPVIPVFFFFFVERINEREIHTLTPRASYYSA